jgi:hypothetical protein
MPALAPRHCQFRLFHHVETRHRQPLRAKAGTRSRVPMPAKIQCDHGNFVVVRILSAETRLADGGTALDPITINLPNDSFTSLPRTSIPQNCPWILANPIYILCSPAGK